MAWSKMISMEMDDEDKLDTIAPMPITSVPDYPYGLRICLTEKELGKLGLAPNCEVGDVIDMRCFGRVTSLSTSQVNDGDMTCRVEIQIEEMSVENEMTE